MEKNHLRLMMAIALMKAAWFTMPTEAFAQEMVTAVANNGLEKTISYDVSKFTDIRDKKLEDVMKKMPGLTTMSWDGSTSFSYNGMFIDKIYVNGLDVLEGNYDPIYNMKPEDVERLEITENHVSIKIMKGMQYSNAASINVILKDHANSKWTGSIKGGVGITPLLINADINAINIGNKLQSTILFKADNTGLDFGGALTGFGGMEWGNWNTSLNSFDYSIKQFLDVEPSLAPLSSERVRFNRSGIINIGSTLKLNKDYQVNLQLLYHNDRLTASSLDETTYYLSQGERVVDVVGENAKSHQQDIEANLTLLANTDSKYLRNQLSIATRWNDVDKRITGTFPNDQKVNTTPLLVKNDLLYKWSLGRHILTLNSNIGIYSRPQDMVVNKGDGIFSQIIKATSAFADANITFDTKLNNQLTISIDGGVSGNNRNMDVKLLGVKGTDAPNIDSRLNVFNAFGGATLTFINDRLQATATLPLKYGSYSMKDKLGGLDNHHGKFYFSPSLSVKYEATNNISLSLEASATSNEVKRMNLYPNLVFSNFRMASEGLPDMSNSKNTSVTLSTSYSHLKTSFFVNGSVSYWATNESLIPVMDFTDEFIINGYSIGKNKSDWWEGNVDISKGINSLKGKIGITTRANLSNAKMERNGSLIAYTSTTLTVSPYINGRLNSWWNVVYQLNFNTNRLKMEDEETSSTSKSYTQTLEMIFSPWKKLNFSLLGEHYYTEFSDDVSKHLALLDFKAEYNINEKWQLIFSAKNILNQKTYNYTLVDSERFTKSYTAYEIRPRNILLSLYYKF